jgi:hypothetical protein
MELMPADEQEATEWLHRRIPKRLRADRPGQVEFERRGALTSVGIFRVKRVSGF